MASECIGRFRVVCPALRAYMVHGSYHYVAQETIHKYNLKWHEYTTPVVMQTSRFILVLSFQFQFTYTSSLWYFALLFGPSTPLLAARDDFVINTSSFLIVRMNSHNVGPLPWTKRPSCYDNLHKEKNFHVKTAWHFCYFNTIHVKCSVGFFALLLWTDWQL